MYLCAFNVFLCLIFHFIFHTFYSVLAFDGKGRNERFEEMIMDFIVADKGGRDSAGYAAVTIEDFVDGENDEDYIQPYIYACEWKEKYKEPQLDSRIPFDPKVGRIILTHKHEKPLTIML